MLTCTWAPTTFQGPRVVRAEDDAGAARSTPSGHALRELVRGYVQRVESLGISHLLIPQRWWGSGEEIEGSSLDCLAMTAFIASVTERLELVTAIHPGFFSPSVIAKWGATMDLITGGRWAINLTSGWNLAEFDMYGVPALEHDERYQRTAEFVTVLRRAWEHPEVSFHGRYYSVERLRVEPRPTGELTVYQGGQSDAALALAGQFSDWMFLNGGSAEKIGGLIERARACAAEHGRSLRFAVYAAPLCRETDAAAWDEIDARLTRVDAALVARRKARVSGAQGMWSGDDPLSVLDTNEGYAARLIGSPSTVLQRIADLKALGVDMLHLDLRDEPFTREVLPHVHDL